MEHLFRQRGGCSLPVRKAVHGPSSAALIKESSFFLTNIDTNEVEVSFL